MTVLVDTSALYALLDEDDDHHAEAADTWRSLLATERLVTHTYVVAESSALVARRLGMAAAAQLHRGLLPVVDLVAIDEPAHARAVDRWLGEGRRLLSLVDVASFQVMRDQSLTHAFAFDDDFVREGFTTHF